MSYTEVLLLANKYLTNITDNRLKYYYINYFYICSKYNLLSPYETIEELLIKVNEYGHTIKYFDSKKDKESGTNIKGFVNIEKCKGLINVRKNLLPTIEEKVIYHEIHHLVQINQEEKTIGITRGMNYHIINEAETEFVAEFVYNKVHDLYFEEKEDDSKDIYMYEGEKVISSSIDYKLFDNILTKLCILFSVDKSFFVILNYNYKDGGRLLKSKFEKLIQEYLKNTKGMRYNFNYDDFMFFMNSIYLTYNELAYEHEITEDTYIYDNYNNNGLVSLRFMKDAIDYLDLIIFELTLDKDKKRELIKYTVNKNTKERFINELDNNCKIYTMSSYLNILY